MSNIIAAHRSRALQGPSEDRTSFKAMRDVTTAQYLTPPKYTRNDYGFNSQSRGYNQQTFERPPSHPNHAEDESSNLLQRAEIAIKRSRSTNNLHGPKDRRDLNNPIRQQVLNRPPEIRINGVMANSFDSPKHGAHSFHNVDHRAQENLGTDEVEDHTDGPKKPYESRVKSSQSPDKRMSERRRSPETRSLERISYRQEPQPKRSYNPNLRERTSVNPQIVRPSVNTQVNRPSERGMRPNDQSIREVHDLKSRINNIEGQLNALGSMNSLNNSQITVDAPGARSQGCLSRKNSYFSRNEPANPIPVNMLKVKTFADQDYGAPSINNSLIGANHSYNDHSDHLIGPESASEKAFRRIDSLIQSHFFGNAAPSVKSVRSGLLTAPHQLQNNINIPSKGLHQSTYLTNKEASTPTTIMNSSYAFTPTNFPTAEKEIINPAIGYNPSQQHLSTRNSIISQGSSKIRHKYFRPMHRGLIKTNPKCSLIEEVRVYSETEDVSYPPSLANELRTSAVLTTVANNDDHAFSRVGTPSRNVENIAEPFANRDTDNSERKTRRLTLKSKFSEELDNRGRDLAPLASPSEANYYQDPAPVYRDTVPVHGEPVPDNSELMARYEALMRNKPQFPGNANQATFRPENYQRESESQYHTPLKKSGIFFEDKQDARASSIVVDQRFNYDIRSPQSQHGNNLKESIWNGKNYESRAY